MINLLPTDIRTSIHYARLNTALVQYGVIVFVLVLLVAGVMLFGFNIAQSDENALRDSISQKENELSSLLDVEEEAQGLAKKIDTVDELLQREVRFSEVMQEIGSILPQGSVLTSLRLANNTEEPLQLSALVSDKQTAAVLRQNIEDSDRFSVADIESIIVNLDENGTPDGFTVSIIATPAGLSSESTTSSGPNGDAQ